MFKLNLLLKVLTQVMYHWTEKCSNEFILKEAGGELKKKRKEY